MKSKIKDVWVSENRTEEKWASGFWFVFVEFLRAQGAVLKEVERKKAGDLDGKKEIREASSGGQPWWFGVVCLNAVINS